MFRDPRMLKRPRLELNRVTQATQQASRPTSSNFSGSLPTMVPPTRQPPPQQKPTTPLNPSTQSQSEERPKAVFLDEQGRLHDDKGNIINLKQTSELKINQKTHQDSKTKDLLKLKKFGESQAASNNETKRLFFDPSLDSKLNKRIRRKQGAFNFVSEGTFIKRGDILRKNQVLQEYEQMKQSNEEEKKDSEQIDTNKKDEENLNEGKILIKRNLRQYDPAPEIEWWDAAFLPPDNSYGDEQKKFPYPEISEQDIHIGMITNYIQHPKKLKNEYIENINKMVVPIHLTEKEKKRLRRMKRVDKEKDKQEKIKLGLLPPPLPKVKLSNYMKIMGKEAISDPSRVEQRVKKIVEKRLEDHLKRNESNKLTRDQREAKMKRKHERDMLQNECRIAVFKIQDLTQPHLKFKVDMNAQQLHMGGFCLIADQTMAPDLPNLVVVEGGPRVIKKFKRLMLRRIDWNSKSKSLKTQSEEENESQKNDKDEEIEDNIKFSKDKKCFLIWEGLQKKKVFEKWRVVDVRSEKEAKRLLGEKNCEQFWNMALTFQPERAEGEEKEQLEKILA